MIYWLLALSNKLIIGEYGAVGSRDFYNFTVAVRCRFVIMNYINIRHNNNNYVEKVDETCGH